MGFVVQQAVEGRRHRCRVVGIEVRTRLAAHLGQGSGIGYRHRPGVLFVESIGPVMLTFDVYWR